MCPHGPVRLAGGANSSSGGVELLGPPGGGAGARDQACWPGVFARLETVGLEEFACAIAAHAGRGGGGFCFF